MMLLLGKMSILESHELASRLCGHPKSYFSLGWSNIESLMMWLLCAYDFRVGCVYVSPFHHSFAKDAFARENVHTKKPWISQ